MKITLEKREEIKSYWLLTGCIMRELQTKFDISYDYAKLFTTEALNERAVEIKRTRQNAMELMRQKEEEWILSNVYCIYKRRDNQYSESLNNF